ncbi:MAG: DUF2207 domain-containing protein [Candidatus Saccharibacteria bacterium]
MKNVCTGIILALIISLVFVGVIPSRASADVNDFSFSSFDADYYLSKDSEGRSTLRVVETLTAEFVNIDQNKGIERAIPRYYDGHSLSFKLLSLTRNGQTEPIFEQRSEPNFTVVSTGTDDYVNGTQRYVFTYTLRDVTKDFGNHQEFYWDTNGTGWSQSFDNLSVRVHLSASISSDFTGAISCYKGIAGSKTGCSSKYDVKNKVIAFKSGGLLSSGENLTLNLSFKPKTFIGYQLTVADIIPYSLVLIAVLFMMIAIYIKIKFGRNNPGRGIIIAEYLPPKNISVLLAAEVCSRSSSSSTAQILDLAVRHKIKIIESIKKVLFFETTSYSLEIINIEGLNKDELSFIDILFGTRQMGSKYEISEVNYAKTKSMGKLFKSINKESIEQGYRLKLTYQQIIQTILISSVFLLLFSAATMSIIVNDATNIPIIFIVSFVLFVPLLVLAASIGILKPLTAKGRELYDYLQGLKLYIGLAEIDRLKFLQSPSGAEKITINTDDNSKMVVLYERVLPYAVLFGQETEWLKQLGLYYEATQTSPLWYSGTGTFDASSFASSVGSFTSYSDSSSSSSSSGSGGGGSSGGGGGGGGGGGR